MYAAFADQTTVHAATRLGRPASRRRRSPRDRDAPPQLYFVVSAVFHYLGPSFAVLLFARVDVLGVAWLRIASAAVVFALWRRPWRVVRARSTATGAGCCSPGAPCSRS